MLINIVIFKILQSASYLYETLAQMFLIAI